MTSVSKKICFYLTTRGNYAKTATIIDVLKDDPDFELQYIVGGGCPSMEFHGPVRHITMIPTGTFTGTYKTAGLISMEAGVILQELMPDALVIVADRFECLPMAMVAFYMGIPIVHLEGGERSACIDDKIRDAITHMATLHFPCTQRAYDRVAQLTGQTANVFLAGATSFDMLRLHGDRKDTPPYVVSILHTNNIGRAHAEWQTKTLLWALSDVGVETYWIRPNIDTDSDLINSMMNRIKWPHIRVMESLKIEEYAPLLANAACFVGNSSSGIREAGYFGTPSVLMGDRQLNRERTPNVIDVPCDSLAIRKAVQKQVEHGRYAPDYTYGDGFAGERIAKVLQGGINVAA